MTIEAEAHGDAHQRGLGRFRRVGDAAVAGFTGESGSRDMTPVRVVRVIGQSKQLAKYVVLPLAGQRLDFPLLGFVGQRLLVTALAGGECRQPRMLARLVVLVTLLASDLELLNVLLMAEGNRLQDRSLGTEQ